MLEAILERIQRTLLVDRMAVFLADVDSPGFIMAHSSGIAPASELDLSFLSSQRPEFAEGHLFFDNTRQAVREEPRAQETIAALDLNYYIPCTVMNRTIAMLGLGKTSEGDFLSSEDVELLETLAGYIGIALQNARLYASLEEKAQEYERLKEFNENIVESINVGVFAADLQDKIESWNSQMEVMYALPRARRHRQVRFSTCLPPAFCEEFFRVRDNPGIHNLYKFRLGTTAGDTRVVNVGHCAAGQQGLQRGRTAGHRRRHHRAHRAGGATGAGRQDVFDRPAGRRSGARGEYSAGRHQFLCADAGQAVAGR